MPTSDAVGSSNSAKGLYPPFEGWDSFSIEAEWYQIGGVDLPAEPWPQLMRDARVFQHIVGHLSQHVLHPLAALVSVGHDF